MKVNNCDVDSQRYFFHKDVLESSFYLMSVGMLFDLQILRAIKAPLLCCSGLELLGIKSMHAKSLLLESKSFVFIYICRTIQKYNTQIITMCFPTNNKYIQNIQ